VEDLESGRADEDKVWILYLSEVVSVRLNLKATFTDVALVLWVGLLRSSLLIKCVCLSTYSILADPGFLYKLAFDEIVTIGNAVWWEFQHRGER
jgi:hypothetical protein